VISNIRFQRSINIKKRDIYANVIKLIFFGYFFFPKIQMFFCMYKIKPTFLIIALCSMLFVYYFQTLYFILYTLYFQLKRFRICFAMKRVAKPGDIRYSKSINLASLPTSIRNLSFSIPSSMIFAALSDDSV
jgi:hypothetical protein